MAPPSSAPDAKLVKAGRKAYERNKCSICHKLAGKGGTLARPLDEVGLRRDEAGVRGVLENPQAEFPNTKMPRFQLKPAEIDALVIYLSTLRGLAPAK